MIGKELKASRQEVFIIEWASLPREQRDLVKDHLDYRFANDVFLEWHSEMQPYPLNDDATEWSSYDETLSMEQIESYWKDQCETNNFKGDLDDFIKDYGLKFEIWILEQKFDLTGIRKILIDVSW